MKRIQEIIMDTLDSDLREALEAKQTFGDTDHALSLDRALAVMQIRLQRQILSELELANQREWDKR